MRPPCRRALLLLFPLLLATIIAAGDTDDNNEDADVHEPDEIVPETKKEEESEQPGSAEGLEPAVFDEFKRAESCASDALDAMTAQYVKCTQLLTPAACVGGDVDLLVQNIKDDGNKAANEAKKLMPEYEKKIDQINSDRSDVLDQLVQMPKDCEKQAALDEVGTAANPKGGGATAKDPKRGAATAKGSVLIAVRDDDDSKDKDKATDKGNKGCRPVSDFKSLVGKVKDSEGQLASLVANGAVLVEKDKSRAGGELLAIQLHALAKVLQDKTDCENIDSDSDNDSDDSTH